MRTTEGGRRQSGLSLAVESVPHVDPFFVARRRRDRLECPGGVEHKPDSALPEQAALQAMTLMVEEAGWTAVPDAQPRSTTSQPRRHQPARTMCQACRLCCLLLICALSILPATLRGACFSLIL